MNQLEALQESHAQLMALDKMQLNAYMANENASYPLLFCASDSIQNIECNGGTGCRDCDFKGAAGAHASRTVKGNVLLFNSHELDSLSRPR